MVVSRSISKTDNPQILLKKNCRKTALISSSRDDVWCIRSSRARRLCLWWSRGRFPKFQNSKVPKLQNAKVRKLENSKLENSKVSKFEKSEPREIENRKLFWKRNGPSSRDRTGSGTGPDRTGSERSPERTRKQETHDFWTGTARNGTAHP